ncbi:hypothetical protein BG011_002142 [Mortierella polycephala]|uniref:MYND-type domain-containing protein n=1 Tax=Mortierella polycephala TaxID=41804 RepID=A0A9P6U564_9FUNG|nr:hypothetical protein BG011_002142 [Mortierella polycephala]
MSRRRSLSTSSIGVLAKSPSSLTASLSASVALYDTHQPPKTLQDILLLAQSHYISHRYVPALTLYRLAAERHHSLPACCSLYALYTSTVNAPGLIRSDTKATEVLINALRIWTARRWSSSRMMETGSRRSKTRDEHSELEEYFVNSGIRSKSHQRSVRSPGSSISISKRSNRSEMVAVAASAESEYRQPQFMSNRDNVDQSKDDDKGSCTSSKENDECSSQEDESDDDDYEDCEDCSDYEESDEEDEEHIREEEARRIGLATMEIDDIVQKLCLMVQKGELGLNEPVLVEAISMLRKIERGLKQEEEARKVEQTRSMSLQASTLAGERRDESMSTQSTNLLLTKGIDLSFLDLTSENGFSIAPTRPLRHRSGEEHSRHHSLPHQPTQHLTVPTTIRNSPINPAILRMSTKENEADQAMCRSLRIRIMFTLGWVHMQKGEYHYGAQAYGVCSEITPTRKRTLDSLQHQATVQKWTCIAFEKKKAEQEQERIQREAELELKKDLDQAAKKESAVLSRNKSTGVLESSHQASSSRPLPVKDVSVSYASSIYTTSDASTAAHNPDISSPSSFSSSESAAVSIRGHVGTISSLSAAMWNSGLFKPSSTSSAETPTPTLSSAQSDSTPKPAKKLQRSKSADLGLKINTLEARAAPEVKDPHHHHHHHHHHPRAQHRPKGQQLKQQQEQQQLTMVGHQKKMVKCGHCDEKRVLMPLCVCKKVRYCNRECRLADLEAHRQTGCHAALMSLGGASGLVAVHVDSAVSPGVTV